MKYPQTIQGSPDLPTSWASYFDLSMATLAPTFSCPGLRPSGVHAPRQAAVPAVPTLHRSASGFKRWEAWKRSVYLGLGLAVARALRVRRASERLQSLPSLEGKADESLRFSEMANWIAPGQLMVGRYPMIQKNKDACQRHLQRLVREAEISTFVCVQSEVPGQEDLRSWPAGGIDVKGRRCLPYAKMARQLAVRKLHFVHQPMRDLEVPGNEHLLAFTEDLEAQIQQGERILVHCMGGRGRSNLVAGCLLARLYDLSPNEVESRLQDGYDSRNYDNCLVPETQRQRETLRKFIETLRA